MHLFNYCEMYGLIFFAYLFSVILMIIDCIYCVLHLLRKAAADAVVSYIKSGATKSNDSAVDETSTASDAVNGSSVQT